MLKTVSFHARAATAALAVLATFALSAHAAPRGMVTAPALTNAVAAHRADVPEFQFIREQAKSLGIRVWLFGGTAAGYGHYVKWDLQRKSGDTRFQPDRFDYDYTNIYRSTQDADLVVDGTPEAAEKLAKALAQKFPHLQGSKSAWEVRLLKQAVGAKDALLDNPDYLNQHTDSNSTGMIELTDPPTGESVIRDLRDWKSAEPIFLKDLAAGKLHYYFSNHHKETARAKSGDNPEIFSAVRLLTKAFQYELTLRPEDWAQVQAVIDRFDPKRDLTTPYSQAWLEKNAKKLMQHAVNLEYAWNTLEKLGLRKKLIALKNDAGTEQSLAWWLSKEPLRDQALGTQGRTAREVFASTGAAAGTAPLVLAHETNSFLAYESITRAHTGDPNILISRNGHVGEAAAYGDGFYTRLGREGARDTGRTIRFTLDPNAREGEDFFRAASDYVVILNKRAIRVIPESLNMNLVDYFRMLADGKTIPASDRGILEKLKRRLNAKSQSLSAKDAEEIFAVVEDHLASKKVVSYALLSEFLTLTPGIGQRARVDKIVDGLLARKDSKSYLIVMDCVLSRPWSANRPDWAQQIVRSPRVNLQDVVIRLLTLPHWRDQAPVIDSVVQSERNLSDLVSKVLIPYWQARPEFNGWVSKILAGPNGGDVAMSVASHILVQPERAQHLEWLDFVMRSHQLTTGWVTKHVLSLSHWRVQAKAVQLAINRDFELPLLIGKVLIPYWQGKPEFSDFIAQILKKDSPAHTAILNDILSLPEYANREDWMEAILESQHLFKGSVVHAFLTSPQWRNRVKIIQRAIDLDYELPALLKVVLIPYWQGKPEFVGFVSDILKKKADHSFAIAVTVLTLPEYGAAFDWMEAFLRKPNASMGIKEWATTHLLTLPHWRDQAKVVRLAIDLKYDLSGLVERVLVPHWRGRPEFPEFVSAILRNDQSAHGAIERWVLTDPASAAHPEWFEAVLDSPGASRKSARMIKELLTLAHWRSQAGLIRATIAKGKDLEVLLEEVLIPYWKDRPEFARFVADLVRSNDREVHLAVANKLLIPPEPPAPPEWFEAVIRGRHLDPQAWVKGAMVLPHWRVQVGAVRAVLQSYPESSCVKTLIDLVIEPDWKSRPEFGLILTDLVSTKHGNTYAKTRLLDPGLAANPQWLHTWIDENRGNWTWLYENVLSLPHWQRHPEYPALIEKLVKKVEHDPATKEKLLGLLHWQDPAQKLSDSKDGCLLSIQKALR